MKKWLAGLLCLCAVWIPCGAEETLLPAVDAPSAVLMTLEGQVLYEKNAHDRREPASVTKVMTMLLVCEAVDGGLITLDDPVTASAHAASMGGSQIWLEEGETLTVGEMLKCVAVVSANDCAVALGEHLAGSEQAFVQKMNGRARELGMADTAFVNACGLTAPGHETSAYDIGLMSAELLKNHPWICDYVTVWQDTVRDGASVLNNTNKLLKSYGGVTGLKTGYTSTAGYCVAASARREDLHLIAVVMGAESSADRNAQAAAMLDAGFAAYTAVTFTADRPLLPLPVELGKAPLAEVELAPQQPLVVEKARLNRIEKTVELPESLCAPVEQGRQVGALVVRCDGEELCRIPILAVRQVEKQSLWDLFRLVLGRAWGKG